MKNFNRGNNRFGGRRSFGNQDFSRRDSFDRPMHRAICSQCGQECELPFRPTGAKLVYCSRCFQNNRGFEPKRLERRNEEGRFSNFGSDRNNRKNENSDGQLKKQLESLNWKLDKILKILTPAVIPEIVQIEKTEKETLPPKSKKTIIAKKKKQALKKEAIV